MPWNEFCRLNFDTDFLNDDTPLFYKQLLQYLFDFYATKPEGVTEILSDYSNIIIGFGFLPLYCET